jgi:MraZ protein
VIGYLGEYEITLDGKGRFLLPIAFRKQLPEAAQASFVVSRGFEPCLNLYTADAWQKIAATVSALNDFDPEQRSFKRLFYNGSSVIEPDTAGRILLPKQFIQHAGLEKDMVFYAMDNKVEIWDKAKYKQFFESYSPTQVSDLAKKLLGGNPTT